MEPVVCVIEIACPPTEVFAYATDPVRFAEWQHDVVRVRVDAGGPVGVGSRFATTRRIGRAERTMTQEVTAIRPPGSWAVRGIGGPIRPHVTVSVEPLRDGAESRVAFTFDFEGHGIGVLLAPVVRRMAARGAPASLRHLKERLESGGHGPPSHRQ